MSGFLPPDANDEHDVEALREAVGLDPEPSETPTHECMRCNDEVARIESSPTKDYRWCPVCEDVTKWKRLDRNY